MPATGSCSCRGSTAGSRRVGTIAAIESAGDLPNGTRALVIRGVSRGRVGTGELGAHGALHVAGRRRSTRPRRPPAPASSPASTARSSRRSSSTAARAASPTCSPGSTTRASSPTPPPTRPSSRWSSGSSCSRRRRRGAPRAGARVDARDARRPRAEGQDPHQRHRRSRQAAARAVAAPPARRDPQGARRGRRRRRRRVPRQVRRQGAARRRCALAVDKELDRLERMGQQNPEQAWVRNWLDAVVDLPWGEYATGEQRHPRRARECSTPITKASPT